MTEPRILNGRYEVGELIGRGGMADVYLARDIRLGRTVAIKLLRADLARDPVFQSRFRREAQAVAALNHPTIVSIYDTGEQDLPDAQHHDVRVPFIVMEYVSGHTLRELIRSGELTIGQSMEYALGVLSALEYSHRAGIVHRDIKPANVMVTPEGNVKVMDFGIARALADSAATMTQTHAVIGTAQYLSPEQARGESVDARSDLYSAGCLFYEMLTGRPPFVGDSPVSVAYQHVRELPDPPSQFNAEVTPALDSVLNRALQKDRQDRFQDARAFQAAIRAAAEGIPVTAAVPSAPAAPPAPARAAAAAQAGSVPSEDQSTQTFAAVAGATSVLAVGATAGSGHAAAAGERNGQAQAHPAHDVVPGSRSVDDGGASARRRRRRGWIAAATVLMSLLIIAGAYYLVTFLNQAREEALQVSVPQVRTLSSVEAQNALVSAGLRPIVEDVFDDDLPRGQAVGTDPGSGEMARRDQEVSLKISKGPDQVLLSEALLGQSEATVRDALRELGLVVGNVTLTNNPTVPRDRLVSTNPPLGNKVPAGSTVDLITSSGQVTVPQLVDLSREQAQQALTGDPAVNLKMLVLEEVNTVVAPGTVVEQSHAAGTDVPQGTTVTVTVATAPAATPTPTPAPAPAPEPTPSSTPPSETPAAGGGAAAGAAAGNNSSSGSGSNAGGNGNNGQGNGNGNGNGGNGHNGNNGKGNG